MNCCLGTSSPSYRPFGSLSDKRVSSTPANVCIFADEVKRQQHRWWLVLLHRLVCSLAFVAVATQLLKNVPDAVVTATFYGSTLLLYIPAFSLYRLKCPYCHRSAGAFPIFQYTFLICRACRERIECRQT
jgi:hypothetical protein